MSKKKKVVDPAKEAANREFPVETYGKDAPMLQSVFIRGFKAGGQHMLSIISFR